ncbi:MAG: ABC-2 family transporter protein [bacterium]|nr:ABC-2 family transporter protein [bacterium]
MKKTNIQAYIQVYRTRLIRSFHYKFEVYGNVLMQAIIMLAGTFFWRALFGSATKVQGVTVDMMLTYTVVSSMISILLTTNVERRITQSVMKGTIAIDMMRPINIFGTFLAEDLAGVTGLIFQNLIPVFVIGSLVAGLPKPASLASFWWFLLSLFMGFWINWLLAAVFGMIAFWAIDMDALIQVKKHLIRLLSGSIIPLWFFPDWLRSVLEYLPFAYLYQLPLNIYIGKYTTETLVKGLEVQLLWFVLLAVLFLFLQKRVTGKVMVQGG